ncbi:major facilitator superfamily domain-containing protein, partial [Thamnocephalis sphaerospora]
LLWGYMADRIGRLPVLMIGHMALTVRALLLGISTSFSWMVTTVVLTGICNGGFSIFRTMMSDVSDATNQVKAFRLLSIVYSLGTTLGPLLGGILAHAMDNATPKLGIIRLLQQYPYLLPYAASALSTVSSALLAFYTFRANPSLGVSSHVASNAGINETTPLLASQAKSSRGGLGMRAGEVGFVMSVGGIVRLATQMFAVVWLQHRIGAVGIYRMALFLLSFVLLLLPQLNHLMADTHTITGLAWAILLIARSMYAFASSLGDVSTMLIVRCCICLCEYLLLTLGASCA